MTDRALVMAYDNATEKLQKLLDENNWDIEVQCKNYPITYTYRKVQMPIGSDNPKAPEIKFIFRADVEYVFSVPEDERVDETFFNKLKNLTKEVHRLYILLWFAQKNDRFKRCWEPIWINQNSAVGVISGRYEP